MKLVLKIKIFALVAIFFITHASLCLAQPLIQNVQGTASDGGLITISGYDFGDNGPNIVVFDDFEGGDTGESIHIGTDSATVGKWDSRGTSETQQYSNEYSNSGAKAFRSITGSQVSPSGGISMRTNFEPTKEFYGSWWIFIPAEDPWPGTGGESGQGGPNWKQVWVHSGQNGAQCRDSDVVLPTDLGGGGAICGNCNGRYVKYGNNMNKGQWKRTMVYWYGSASGNGIVDSKYLLKNGSNTVTTHLEDTNVTNMGSDSHYYSLVDANAYCHVTIGDVSRMYIDDFYFASGPNCRARVEIGDAIDYLDSSDLAICTVTGWSNNEIQATVRGGSFQAGDSAYLFVVNADGSISSGYPITIGEPVSGGTTYLAQPTNLRIVSNQTE